MSALTPIGVRLVVRDFALFNTKLKAAGASVIGLDKAALGAAGGMSALGMGLTAVVGIAAATVAGIAAVTIGVGYLAKESVETAASFEQAFAGMLKTVSEFTDPATNQINEFGLKTKNQFRELALEIPLAFEELAEIGTIAGQMDIPADQIAEFTKNIAAISVSTTLTREQAAEDFATISKIFQISRDDIGEWSNSFGSALVWLGNNFATNEDEIIRFAERIAGAGAALGLTETDIIAVGAAFSQSGVQMQRGGTAVQKVLIKMNEALQEGGEQFELIAKVAGKTAEEFSMVEPTEQFRLFVEGLGKEGPEAIQILKELDLADQRLIGAFLNMSSAEGELTRALEGSNVAFEEGTQLAREAEIFYATFTNQAELLKNAFEDLKFIIGEPIKDEIIAPMMSNLNDFLIEMRPFLDETMKEIVSVIKEDLAPAFERLASALGLEFNAEGAVAWIEDVATDTIESVATAIDNIAWAIETYQEKGWAGFEDTAFAIPAEVLETLGYVAGFLSVIAGIIGEDINIGDMFKMEEGEGIDFGGIAGQTGGLLIGVVEGVIGPVLGIVVEFGKDWAKLWAEIFTLDFSGAGDVITGFGEELGTKWGEMMDYFEPLGTLVEEISAFVGEAIGQWWETNTIWEDIGTGIEDFSRTVGEGIVDTWVEFEENLYWLLGAMNEVIAVSWDIFWTTVGDAIDEWWSGIETSVDEWATGVTSALTEVWEDTNANWQENWENLKVAWETWKEDFLKKWEDIKTGVSTKVGEILKAGEELVSKFYELGKSWVQGIISGIIEKWDELMQWVQNLADAAAGVLSGQWQEKSPSKVSAKMGAYFVEGIVEGMQKGLGGVLDVSRQVASVAMQPIADMGSITNDQRITVNANYAETQSPETIADDLALINMWT